MFVLKSQSIFLFNNLKVTWFKCFKHYMEHITLFDLCKCAQSTKIYIWYIICKCAQSTKIYI